MKLTGRTTHVPAALVVAAGLALASLLTGCGEHDDGVRSAPVTTHSSRPTATASPSTTGSPTPAGVPPPPRPHAAAEQAGPRPGSLRDLKQRCFGAARGWQDAFLVYRSPFELSESDSERFTARLVRKPGDAGEGGERVRGHLKVTCTVQARLVTAGDEVANSDTGWGKQMYVPPRSAEWTWVLTGRKPGTSKAVVQLEPVVRVDDGGQVKDEELGTQSFDVTFHVSRSTGTWLSSTGGAVVGTASGLTVIAGAFLAVSRFVRRKPTPADE